jgi:protein O-GlcNAc transferase
MKYFLTIIIFLLFCPDGETCAQVNPSTADSDPQVALDKYRKANALFQKQQYEPALAAVEEALRLDAKLIPALVLKSRLAMVANRFDVARVCLQQAIAIAPDTAEHRFLLGFVHYVENDFVAALESLEHAAELKPDHADAQFYLALTFEGLGRTDDAISAYERGLKMRREEQLADMLVAYGRLLFKLGRFGDSEKLIDRAITAKPDLRDAQYEKGRLRFAQHDYASAIKYGRRALELPGAGTTERQIHYLLARAYIQTGQIARAESHLAKFRAAPPTLRR